MKAVHQICKSHALGLLCALTLLPVCAAAQTDAPAQNTPAPRAPQGQTGTTVPPTVDVVPAPAEKPVELTTQGVVFAPKMEFAAGQTRRYGALADSAVRLPGPNNTPSLFSSAFTLAVTLRYLVRDARPGQPVQMLQSSEGGRMTGGKNASQTMPADPPNQARTLVLDRWSRITSFRDVGSNAANRSQPSGLDALFDQNNLFVPLQILPLPERPVRPGESWTALYATPGRAGAGRDDSEAVSAKLTLLGLEKIAGVDTARIKQVLTVPYTLYTDAQGRATGARSAKGKMRVRLTFTQFLNALPEDGLMVRSEGTLQGVIDFEGALAQQVSGPQMTLSGKIITVRLDDTPATASSP